VPGFVFATKLLAHAWQCGALAQASAGDRWRRRYEGVVAGGLRAHDACSVAGEIRRFPTNLPRIVRI
jgi:hypothetical protein